MADLKPCPFCGGDAGCNRRSGDERDGYADHVTIFCTGCGVRVAASGDTSKGGYADNSTVYERAIAAWNRRAASPADQGEDALDFTPDAQHAVADMANVGYSLMQAIKAYRPGYAWNDTPAEIVGDLVNEVEEAAAPLQDAEDARDAARYRVFRESPSFALTMGQFSTPGIIDALCDAAMSTEEFDSAMDAAMSASKEGA